ncbi:B12-binding domain-containing radical SAM protein [bacterium]|nr:B12-binding domain-containing radical SAM protein [bacterium]
MNIALISIHIKQSPQAMPLAAAMLKSSLDSSEELRGAVESSLFDFYSDQNSEQIAREILSSSPDLVGFSVYLWNRDVVDEVATIIKKRAQHITLFAGGAEATANPFNLLESGLFGFIVKGEGEEAIVSVMTSLLAGNKLESFRGVLVKDDSKNLSIQSAFIADLESVPSPFLTGVIALEKYDGVLWELSRGCPFKCAFCFESRGVASVRRFSLERIKAELELFEKEGVVQVFVLDATFNYDKKRAKEILRMIQEISPSIHFIFEVRTEFIDRELAQLFASINCSLQIGLQSSDVSVLANVNRAMDIKKFREKIAILNHYGVVFGLDLIYGLPQDSFGGFQASIDFALRLQPNNLDVFPLSVFPGTALFDSADTFKMNYMKETPYTVLSTPEFSVQDMHKSRELANALNLFYNQGRAVGWLFMILETVKLSPSEFLGHFSEWLKIESRKEPLLELQIQFMQEVFAKQNRAKLSRPMADIIRYNHSLSSSLDAGFSEIKRDAIDGTTILQYGQGTHLLQLHFELDDLLRIGEVTLVDFVKYARQQTNEVVVFNNGGVVAVQPLDREWIAFLKAVDGRRSLSQIFQSLRIEKSGESDEFISFCLESGILI